MLRYNLLFVHVASAMGMFTALGMEALALAQLRRASDSATAREALVAVGWARRVGGPSVLVLLLSGIWLASAYWRWQGAWMGLGLLGLVSIGAIGGLMTARRIGRLRKSIDDGGLGASLSEAHAGLRTSLVIRAALLAGVVYLMTVKPEPPASLATLGAAIAVGLVLGRVRPRPGTTGAVRATG